MRRIFVDFEEKNPLAMTHCPIKKIVSWALMRFTSLFGMGRGGTTSLQSPRNFFLQKLKNNYSIRLILLFVFLFYSNTAQRAIFGGFRRQLN